MVDWKSPEVMVKCGFVFNQVLVLMLGAYIWDFLLTLPKVEIPLISGRLKWRWVMIAYFSGRYLWLATMVAIVWLGRTLRKLDCRVMFTVLSVIGILGIVCATINLLLRTLVIWRQNRLVFGGLIALGLGQWVVAFIVIATGQRIHYEETIQVCSFTTTELIVFYLYTVVTDFIVLFFTVIGLYRHGVLTLDRHHRLWTKVAGQGIFFFVVTFVSNVVSLVFAWVELNTIMSIIFSIPAATFSIIASSRAVSSLIDQSDTPKVPAVAIFPPEEHQETLCQCGRHPKCSESAQQLTTNLNITELVRTPVETEVNSESSKAGDIEYLHVPPTVQKARSA